MNGSLQEQRDEDRHGKRRLSVLVVTPWFPPTPGEREGNFVLDQVRALVAVGVDVSVVVGLPWVPRRLADRVPRWNRHVDVAQYAGSGFDLQIARYVSLPSYRLGRFAAPIMAAGVSPAITRIVRARGIDVVHAHTEMMGYAGVEAAGRLQCPVVITLHGINPAPQVTNTEAKRRQLRRTLSGANRVVLVGTPLREYFAAFSDRTDHFRVLSNGFRIPGSVSPSTRVPRRRPVRVVSVSNLHANKGVDVTMRALARLDPDARERWEMVVVGDGTERSALEALAHGLGFQDRVSFTGYLPHKEALGEIAAGDVMCLPSWRESCGVVYIEAMALGKVAVGCRGQGPSDYIEHERTGYLVEPESEASVAETLTGLARDPARIREIGERARAYAHEHLTWRRNAARVTDLYLECAGEDAW